MKLRDLDSGDLSTLRLLLAAELRDWQALANPQIVDLAAVDGRLLRAVSRWLRKQVMQEKREEWREHILVAGVDKADGLGQDWHKHPFVHPLFLGFYPEEPGVISSTLLISGLRDLRDSVLLFAPALACRTERDHDQAEAAARTSSFARSAERWAPFIERGMAVVSSHTADQSQSEAFSSIGAPEFLLSLARVGLCAERGSFHRYDSPDRSFVHCLGWFKKHYYRIRRAEEADLPELIRIEEQCWGHGLRASEEQLHRRLGNFPAGQFVLEVEGAIAGVIYSQRIVSDQIENTTAEEVHHLHRDDGSIVQLLSLNILPAMNAHQFAVPLLEFMLQYAATLTAVDAVIGVTRCRDYWKYPDVDLAQYVHLRNTRGMSLDTGLRLHEAHGAQVQGLVPGYRPGDAENLGFGVLVRYDLPNRRCSAPPLAAVGGRHEAQASSVSGGAHQFIASAVAAILGKANVSEVEMDRPIFEFGISSTDLLDLNERIVAAYGLKLQPVFFFQYNTCAKIADYLAGKFGAAGTGNRAEAISPRWSSHLGDVRRDCANTEQPGIAIVGMSCFLPGDVNSPRDLWKVLEQGRSLIGKVPEDRWVWPTEIDPAGEHEGIDRGGFLSDIRGFDAAFFCISPKEAVQMDPQQRLLLHLAWACLEDAGYAARTLAGSRTGVFVGASGSDYELWLAEREIERGFSVGTSMAALANRISYFFDWTGPSLQIDTACSSSLVAIHEAVRALADGSCSQALVAGINLMCHPARTLSYYKSGMLSKDGCCTSFDAKADGYVRSEGAIAVLLKPLAAAIHDEDRVHAVIRGSAINHGGLAAGVTVPNPLKQAELIELACAAARISPRELSYIEAHGSATRLGDVVEIDGLKRALASASDAAGRNAHCGFGSIKTNLGHLEAAAGLAGLLKVVMSLQHRELPATLHFRELNPQIDLFGTPLFVVDRKQNWKLPDEQSARKAGISSFGSGGANAHVIVEEYTPSMGERVIEPSLPNTQAIVVLSAKNQSRLREQARRLLAALDELGCEHSDLRDIAYTLQVGREPLPWRLCLLVTSTKELGEKLTDFLKSDGSRLTGAEGIFVGYNDRPSRSSFGRTVEEVQAGFGTSADLRLIAEQWTQGAEFDWNRLYPKARPHRIELPCYPFENSSYWFEATETPKRQPHTTNDRNQEPAHNRDSREECLPSGFEVAWNRNRAEGEPVRLMTFQEAWEEAPVGAPVFALQHVVCFASDRNLQNAVREALGAVSPGAGITFAARAGAKGSELGIDSQGPGSFQRLFSEIGERHPEIDAVLYLWPIEDQAFICDPHAIVYLAQAIAVSGIGCKRICLAGAYRSVLDRCRLDAWIGFERSLGLALPNIEAAVVFGEAAEGEEIGQWPKRAIAEIAGAKFESAHFQRDRRYVRRMREQGLESRDPGLRPGGTYLVTGGAGRLGGLVAERLASKYNANVVLTGSSELNHAIVERIGSWKGAERLAYLQADVSDSNAMRSAVRETQARFGRLDGVIHAAGVNPHGTFLENAISRFDDVVRPKIEGVLAIEEGLGGEEADFVCYFSSISSVLGDFGSCDYAIGNRFQLAYAQHGPASKFRRVAIAWPLWQEGRIGLPEGDARALYLKGSGQEALESGPALDLLESVLDSGANHCIAIVGQPERVRTFLGRDLSYSPALLPPASVHADSATPRGGRRDHEVAEGDLSEWVIANLASQACPLLGLTSQEIDLRKNLVDLGFDSIGLRDLASRIGEAFGLRISPAIFFSYPTLEQLAEYLLSAHREALESFYGEPSKLPAALSCLRKSESVTPAAVRPHQESRSFSADEPIAIIGMSGRFPQARDTEEMWGILADGREVVASLPEDRLDCSLWDDSFEPGAGLCAKKMGAIPGVREFDPLFFEISPLEAESMDPRHRLLLQECWRALEDAGYGRKHLERQTIGVFVGAEQGEYQRLAGGSDSLTANHDAMLPSRLAYFLDLHGPVMTINTACSSGLVALHEACLSLRSAECDAAIVASANLLLTPHTYTAMCRSGMMSRDGRCYAFDSSANGMVPGEAVVAVVLKRLSQAEADSDPILAVIQASGINYDGRTAGITAPSGDAQSRLYREVYRRGHVDPRKIEYVVAHGTGTKLGDPVEINALRSAFGEFTSDSQFCALTSAKTNFGHTLAAAGLVNLVTLVQAMRHEMIPASLHWNEPNPYIEWGGSPFYVNRSNRAWPKTPGRSRWGATSAFGVSGTNAHAVLRSYEPTENIQIPSSCCLLALSAKTPKAMRDRIQDLAGMLGEGRSENASLREISYTLLCGRQHFPYRLAVVASSMAQASTLLQQSLAQSKASVIFRGEGHREPRNRKVLVQLARELVARVAAVDPLSSEYRDHLRDIAELYCEGYELDWEAIFGSTPIRRVHLPVYPFAREDYWIQHSADSREQNPPSASLLKSQDLGSLVLREEAPGEWDWLFTVSFTGEEYFLVDHRVLQRKVMPGVVYLELARMAALRCIADSRAAGSSSFGCQLRHVSFLAPRIAEKEFTLQIGIRRQANGEMKFALYTCDAEIEQRVESYPEVHCEGTFAYLAADSPKELDLRYWQARCNGPRLSQEECYTTLAAMGLNYGPAFQSLCQVETGLLDSSQPFVLARLTLPRLLEAISEKPMLHPSMADGALQSIICLMTARKHNQLPPSTPLLPFSIQRVDILHPCKHTAWAVVTPAGDSTEAVSKWNVDICDEGGQVCVSVRGFSLRSSQGLQCVSQPNEEAFGETQDSRLITMAPFWDRVPVDGGGEPTVQQESILVVGGSEAQRRALTAVYNNAHQIVFDDQTVDMLAQQIGEIGTIRRCVWLAQDQRHLNAGQEVSVIANRTLLELFRLTKALLQCGYGSRELSLTFVTARSRPTCASEPIDATAGGVRGLAGCLANEYENWNIRLLDIEDGADLPVVLSGVSSLGERADLASRGGEWYRQKLVKVDLPPLQASRFRQGGVYVIIGGAGGIGEAFSEYLVRSYGAQLVWIGRRAKDAGIAAKIKRLAQLGPEPLYISTDAAEPGAMAAVRDEIRSKFPAIHGLVHSAIVLRDKSLEQMDEERLFEALKAKIDVTVTMAEAFRSEALDFVLFFSSWQSFMTAPGQSNYAAGSTFEDAFAHEMARSWACPVKVVNWGYWGDVGIVASPGFRERMARAGLGSINVDEAMLVLEKFLTAPFEQIACVKTLPEGNSLVALDPNERSAAITEPAIAMPCSLDAWPRELPLDVPALRRTEESFSRALGQLLSSVLFSCGLLPGCASGERASSQLGPVYRRWLNVTLQLLSEQGVEEPPDDAIAPQGRLIEDLPAAWDRWHERKRRWQDDPGFRAQQTIAEVVLGELTAILFGDKPATDVLFPDSSTDLVSGFYRNSQILACTNEAIARFVCRCVESREEKEWRLLEVGAGTGSTSEKVFDALAPCHERVVEYCYTDSSKAFLLHAEAKFASSVPYLRCHLLDAEVPVRDQGFAEGAYDVVIATNVLHATHDIGRTLRNVKLILKRGGLLLLNEISTNTLFAHLIFGLLEGWWRYGDHGLRIPGGPGLFPDQWKGALARESFGNILFPLPDAHQLGQQIIAAQSDGIVRRPIAPNPSLAAAVPSAAARALQASRSGGGAATVVSEPAARAVKSLRDRLRSLLRDCIGEALKIDKSRVNDEQSFSEIGVDSIIAVGLVNRINRRCSLTLPTTILFDYNNIDRMAQYLAKTHGPVLTAWFEDSGGHEVRATNVRAQSASASSEIARSAEGLQGQHERNSKSGASKRQAYFLAGASQRESASAPGSHPAGPRSLVIERPGTIDDLQMAAAGERTLGSGEVRIAVHAAALNFGDLLCVKGLYPSMPAYPFTPGFEVAGTVVEVGSSVRSLKSGGAVMAWMGSSLGGHSEVVTCPEWRVLRKPNRLSFAEACSVPAVGITVLAAFDKARLRKGESILIQTAAGGIGLTAIQLAKHYGAEIYATAGSDAKLEYLRKLGVTHLINHRERDFAAELQRMTGGKGVDVILNTLSGDALQKGLNCLAPGGRYIEIAMTALKSAKHIDLSVLTNNQSFFSIDLSKMESFQPEVLAGYFSALGELVDSGVIRPVVCEVVPFDEIRTAYRRLESREIVGKIVVRMASETAWPAASMAAGAIPANSGTGTALPREPIAIVGLSGRFAHAENVSQLWEHLADGQDLTEELSRWSFSGVCPRGSFLENIDCFDPLFFNISALEAEYMDPQQRLFLEECWKALENAGYAGSALDGRECGVYAGCSAGDYGSLIRRGAPPQSFWGNSCSVLPARIAYYLNLHGPAIAVDTACSSSLVAIHLGCQALWSREIELALAGGVFLQCTPDFFRAAGAAGMLSPSGTCYAFDDRANGFVPAEGVGVVVLKRLSAALADNDHIWAVIRGSAINQDGATNGITAPSAVSQERLERTVYETFGIHPEEIQMVEAHGTGTRLGDPIEFRALTQAFRRDTDKRGYCALGSIKTNLGHAATAAGVASVLKVVLSLENRQIPPSLNFAQGNSHIDFESSPFYVNTELKEWAVAAGIKRCAAVSSFGFSGTNAHLVLQEPPITPRVRESRPAHPIVLSARTTDQLRQQVERLVAHLERHPNIDCDDLSYTLVTGRKHLGCRLACVVSSADDPRALLRRWLADGQAPHVWVRAAQDQTSCESVLQEYGEQCIRNASGERECEELHRQLATICELYVQGHDFDFAPLFSGRNCGCIPLPAYPFARDRYWVPEPSESDDRVDDGCAPRDSAAGNENISDVSFFTPIWEPKASPKISEGPSPSNRWVVVLEHSAHAQALRRAAELDRNTTQAEWTFLRSDADDLSGQLLKHTIALIECVQRWIARETGTGLMLQLLLVREGGNSGLGWQNSLAGLLRTIQREYPAIRAQWIEIQDEFSPEAICQCLRESRLVPEQRQIRYIRNQDPTSRDHGLKRDALCRKAISPAGDVGLWEDGGVYLITGGVGGLGRIVALEIARRAAGARVMLVGRSELDAGRGEWLEQLRRAGLEAEYAQVDVEDRAAVEGVIADVRGRWGRLDGVLHAAGAIRDSYLLHKRPEEVRAVLGPKVRGLTNLDEATRDLDLQWMILFSSISGVLGNVGQGDYAVANAFLDEYARYRNELAGRGERRGRTVSIDWPLWVSGGMRVDEATLAGMRAEGIGALETAAGLAALYGAYGSGESQVLVWAGAVEKLLSEERPAEEAAEAVSLERSAGQAGLRTALMRRLKEVVGEVTKLGVSQIEEEEGWESYGIDSLMITQLNRRLESLSPELSKTLFYEQGRLRELVEYLLRDHAEACERWCGQRGRSAEKARARSWPVAGQSQRPVAGREPEAEREENAREGIAIIGMAGRFPQARTLGQYWENLRAGKDCVRQLGEERWSWAGFYREGMEEAVAEGKSYTKWGGFIDGFAEFDPLFFKLSPREAMDMDPQERIFLQASWEALEDAGYTRAELERRHGGRVGVFAGITKTGYELYGPGLWSGEQRRHPHTSFSSVANRVSYVLNLQGPSMPIDTMCSSSLTAIHEACEHLLRGECEAALAGGVNLYLHPASYAALCAQRMLSPDGKCRSFGLGANGFVPGEGVGVVLLKRLSRAEADGDRIHAVIRGTAINHGGRTQGYTVPNPGAQRALIRAALKKAGVPARAISYIEAHGTGTELGDPIEVAGLAQAFGEDTSERGFCALGSVKTNIGHLEAASGIAGLMKVVLQMRHGELAPSLHAEEENPNLDLGKTAFVLQRGLEEWKRSRVRMEGGEKEYGRLAGISSFGAGGANAHVIVEEYTDAGVGPALEVSAGRPALVVLSARDEERLREQAERLLEAAEREGWGEEQLPAVAYTLQVGREAMEQRLALAATSMAELKQRLREWLSGKEAEVYRGDALRHRETLAVFNGEQDLHRMATRWMECAQHDKLLKLWARGLAVDWAQFYPQAKPRPLTLPTYPFAREAYWIEAVDLNPSLRVSAEAVTPALPTVARKPAAASRPEDDRKLPAAGASEQLVFQETWEEKEIVSQLSPARRLVCFLQQPESRQKVLEALSAIAPESETIFVGYPCGVGDFNHDFRIDPGRASDYTRVLNEVLAQYGRVDGVLYLWPLEEPAFIQDYSVLVHLTQALASVADGCARVLLAAEFRDRSERCYLESWIAFVRSLKHVMPERQFGVVLRRADAPVHERNSDKVSVASTSWDAEWWTTHLWDELNSLKCEHAIHEEGCRSVCRVRQSSLPSGAPKLRVSGTYLITGGAGGLGLVCARHLAKQYQANLVLVGRSELDEVIEQKLQKLKEHGGTAMYRSVDICERRATEKLIREIQQGFGGIHGVIHAAGLPAGGSILKKEADVFYRELEAKVRGTVNLDEVLANEPLDFHCYLSSSSAILGDFGACSYAAGNRFQIARASYHASGSDGASPLRIAVAWPLWRDGHMKLATEESQRLYLASSGQEVLETADGLRMLERALSGASGHYLVMNGDRARICRFLGVADSSRSEAPSAADSVAAAARAGWTLHQLVSGDLAGIAASVLRMQASKLDGDTNLADFGFDSIQLADYAQRLRRHYGLEIQPSIFFSYPTLSRLTDFLIGEHRDPLDTFYRSPSETRPPEAAFTRVEAGATTSQAAIEAKTGFQSSAPEPIAIVGLSGRFPQARNIAEMWEILAKGADVVSEIPAERFDWRTYYDATLGQPGRIYGKWLGAIPGAREFDATFFEVPPPEAATMDPRQRLLLQEAWNALEDAGLMGSTLQRQRLGVFVGVEQGDYQRLVPEGGLTGNHEAILASRLAYFLDLHGPAMAINTSCSSGLVAAHQACLSLRAGECDAAVVAAASAMFTPHAYVAMSAVGMLSPDGKTYAFDRRANGLVPGEAVAALVLKPLSAAEAEGYPIYAVIRGSAINCDGRTNGITAPNGAAQVDVLRQAYRNASVRPRDIGYVVSHGTGTRLGDPVEIQALEEVFGESTEDRRFCALTSVKPNFGHAFAASGLVNLACLMHALRHDMIPASLHCEEESDYFDWQRSCFFVNPSGREWPRGNKPRLGAVSSFGMSGTNAHMVLEEYTSAQSVGAGSAPFYLLVFSAKTEIALDSRVSEFRRYLENSTEEPSLDAISHTLLCGRQHLAYRCAMVVADVPQALAVCGFRPEGKQPNVFEGKVGKSPTIQPTLLRYGTEWMERIVASTVTAEEYREAFCLLADLYCQGYELQWERLTGSRLLHLPGYPFARDRHWIADSINAAANMRTAATKPVEPSMQQSRATLAEELSPTSGKPDKIVLSSLSAALILNEHESQMGDSIDSPFTNAISPSTQLQEPEKILYSQTSRSSGKRLLDELTTSLAETLYLDVAAIDQEKTFLDMGLDSITGVEWVRTLNRRYRLSIPVTKLYDYSTIPAMAEFLEMEMERAGQRLQELNEWELPTAIDVVLQQVYDGTLSEVEAKALLQ